VLAGGAVVGVVVLLLEVAGLDAVVDGAGVLDAGDEAVLDELDDAELVGAELGMVVLGAGCVGVVEVLTVEGRNRTSTKYADAFQVLVGYAVWVP
jgi:hypothetical protein